MYANRLPQDNPCPKSAHVRFTAAEVVCLDPAQSLVGKALDRKVFDRKTGKQKLARMEVLRHNSPVFPLPEE
jgi:hypothetical protein